MKGKVPLMSDEQIAAQEARDDAELASQKSMLENL